MSTPWDGAVALDAAAASRWILDQIAPKAPTDVPLAASCGLILAAGVISTEPSPAFDTSAMDGYALHRESGPSTGWRVIGRSLAGEEFVGAVADGEAVRIMTGARVPRGVDAVPPLEIVDEHDGRIALRDELAAGSNIRRAGTDHPSGAAIFDRGTRLTPTHLAVLASIGHARPRVVPRVRDPRHTGVRAARQPGQRPRLPAVGSPQQHRQQSYKFRVEMMNSFAPGPYLSRPLHRGGRR